MNLVNQIRLLRGDFKDQCIIEKMMICLPKKFESELSVIEETCDLKKLSVLEPQVQRRESNPLPTK